MSPGGFLGSQTKNNSEGRLEEGDIATYKSFLTALLLCPFSSRWSGVKSDRDSV